MEPPHKYLLLHSLFLYCSVLFFTNTTQALANPPKYNNSFTCVLVFGDSTVDPGNNNYVKTLFKANFPPYGKDFVDQIPTGRFSNGRLTPDFIASYAGVKELVPPYLDPTLGIEELMTGVSFASAGSGFDPLTPKIGNVISMPKQLEYFKEYKQRLQYAMGKQRTEDHLKRALFIISAGTNDFVVNYFSLPIRQKAYSVSAYQQFVWQQTKQFIQELVDEGARRMVFTGLPPMGCLPIVITLFSGDAIFERGCIDYYSSVARDYNFLLKNELNLLQLRYANVGANIQLNDVYPPLADMIQGRGSSGFEKVTCGCCGTGVLEASLLCNPKSKLCSDASKYVFWDSIHPTEKAYYFLFKAVKPILDSMMKD